MNDTRPTREECEAWAKNRYDDAGRLARAYIMLLDSARKG